MKQVLESHLLHLVTLRSYNLVQNLLSTYPGYFLLKKYLRENTENAISET